MGASPSKEGLSTHVLNRSTWKKATAKDKKVRYNPIESAEALQETIAAHEPYLEKEDPPESDKIEWSGPPGHDSSHAGSHEPSPTPPTQGDYFQPESRG